MVWGHDHVWLPPQLGSLVRARYSPEASSKFSLLRNKTKQNIKESKGEIQEGGRPGTFSEGRRRLKTFSFPETRTCPFSFSQGMGGGVRRCLGRAVPTRWLTDEAISVQGK